MSDSEAAPFCLATTVGAEALEALLENTGAGAYRDDHPWIVAAEMLEKASQAGQQVALLIATGDPLAFSHWGWVETIDVVELHRGHWETRCSFGRLMPINPIFTELDSVFLKPGDDQLHREAVEPIRQHRLSLDLQHIHPYAICDTPAFVGMAATGESSAEPE